MSITLETPPVTEVVVEIPGGHRQVTPQRGGRYYLRSDSAERYRSISGLPWPSDFAGATRYMAGSYVAGHIAELAATPLDEIRAKVAQGAESELTKAADRGTSVHHYAECRIKGTTPDWGYLERCGAAPYLAAVDAYLADHPPRMALTETVVFGESCGHKIGGTVDLIELDGTVVVADFKGLALDTPLPTPTGWTTMGEVEEGDYLLGADGVPCRVIGKSYIRNRPCYRITFDDGTQVVCDDEHLWEVVTTSYGTTKTLDTQTIAETYRYDRGRQQPRYAVRNTQPLELPEADLLVDPYILGVWLGDGCTGRGEVCKPLDRLWEEVRALGYTHTHRQPGENKSCTIHGLLPKLRELGVLTNKHVPPAYLRGSVDQRLALLQGLMDTDGYWNPGRGQAVFSNTLEHLALAVQELVVSLGWRAYLFDGEAEGFGTTTHYWRVTFTPHGDAWPFRCRNTEVDRPNRTRSTRRVISDVELVPGVPTQCVMVDSADSLYLCGYEMVPTHNTRASRHDRREKEAAQLGAYAHCLLNGVYVDENGKDRSLPHIDHCEVVTFCPDGTFKIHPVTLDAAIAAHEARMAFLDLKVSDLFGKAEGGAAPTPAECFQARLDALQPDDKMALARLWTTHQMPRIADLTDEHYLTAARLFAQVEPWHIPDVYVAPLVTHEQCDDVRRRLAALPADIAKDAQSRAAGLRSLSSAFVSTDDLDDWERLLTPAEAHHARRIEEARAMPGFRSIAATLRVSFDRWTALELDQAYALAEAAEAGVLSDLADAPNVEPRYGVPTHTLKLDGYPKRDVVAAAKTEAVALGLTVPKKFDDVLGDVVLFAATWAALQRTAVAS